MADHGAVGRTRTGRGAAACTAALLVLAVALAGCVRITRGTTTTTEVTTGGSGTVSTAGCSLSDAPSPVEAAVIAELNLARTRPDAYAAIIAQAFAGMTGLTYVRGGVNILTTEGRAAVDEAVAAMRKARPVPALVHSPCLSRAAQDHANDTGPKGITGHSGSDGSTPIARVKRYAPGLGYCGENISYGSSSARDIVLQLIVDDGVPSRGHRENIMRPDFRTVGIGTGPHSRYGAMSVHAMCG